MKMPFGKYRGDDLVDVPISYLKWVEENVGDLDPDLRAEINWEIGKREGEVTSLGRVG